MSEDEPRYTLDEAREQLAERECAFHGHDFEILERGPGAPAAVLCGRCGRSWPVSVMALTVADIDRILEWAETIDGKIDTFERGSELALRLEEAKRREGR